MADYYTKLSFMVPFKGEAAEFFQGLLQYCDKLGCGDDPPADMEPRLLEAAKECWFSAEDNTPGVNVVAQDDELGVSDDDGCPCLDQIAEAIHQTLKRFKMPDIVSFRWSNDCSKPRTDAYGGGAVVISARRKRWLNTHSWTEEVKEKWSKKR